MNVGRNLPTLINYYIVLYVVLCAWYFCRWEHVQKIQKSLSLFRRCFIVLTSRVVVILLLHGLLTRYHALSSHSLV